MLPDPHPPVESADCVALAEDLLARPFPAAPTGVYDWVIGRAQSRPDRHFVPVAASEVLEYAPAERWAEDEDELEQRRRQMVSALTAAWGPPQIHSFEPDFERIVEGEELPPVIQDLTLFSFGHHADTWQRGGRIVCVMLGQFDKHYPIVLMLAVTAQPLW
ncbi:hypothetical protein [Dactylosporangium sp. NPDC048998]|uniref:hypothetical protein n=1 Tax=Dactylosporangium sp. NPDC048998 TaxID=3363976 RepID=UPI00372297F2